MPIIVKALSIGAGGVIVSVAIYLGLTNVTASNYPGAILTHLVDIVQGGTTETSALLNSPAWGFGEPMAVPVLQAVGTTTSGTVASSTTYYFSVAAIDPANGTTTLSDGIAAGTDASTSLSGAHRPAESLKVTWAGVPGAVGYAVYFSTSTPTYDQYFLATTTGQYIFATSTGSLAGTNSLTVGTALGARIKQSGRSWINTSSTSTSTPVASTTVFQVGGTVDFVAPATTTACETDTAGVIFFNLANNHEWGCDGSAWTKIF